MIKKPVNTDIVFKFTVTLNPFEWKIYDKDNTLVTSSKDNPFTYKFTTPGKYSVNLSGTGKDACGNSVPCTSSQQLEITSEAGLCETFGLDETTCKWLTWGAMGIGALVVISSVKDLIGGEE